MTPRVLAIGGSDPSGGAGITRDVITLAALGCEARVAVTSITIQDEHRFVDRHDLRAAVLAAQIRAAGAVDAVKTGMLARRESVEVVIEAVRSAPVVVVDPVLRSSTGAVLLDDDALDIVRAELLPLATVVTPNVSEACALTGIEVIDESTQREAAEALVALGAGAAIVTGGHLLGPEIIDVLATREATSAFTHARRPGSVHGTGCTFAAALAGVLASGGTLTDAIERAQGLVGARFAERGD